MRLSQLLNPHDRGVPCTSAVVWRSVACLLSTCLLGVPLQAQVLRGVVRVREASQAVVRARLVAEDRQGKRLGEAISDANGRYQLRVAGEVGVPFRVSVTRIGMQPSLSDEITLADGDTVDADFWVRDLPVEVEEVRTTGVVSLNSSRYNTAKRRGWRVVEPDIIEKRRETALGLNELINSLGMPGLIVPRRNGDCIRSTRMRECLPIIMDGVLIGTNVHLNPRDIYFMAVVSAPDARAEWGDRAAYGALAIYTRMHGDIIKP
jgi:hypothetical protein